MFQSFSSATTAQLTVADTNPAVILSIPLDENTVYLLTATLVAKKTDNTAFAVLNRTALVYRAAGNAVICGTSTCVASVSASSPKKA